MGYSPANNPYVPGDPYSYDLKWIVNKLNTLITSEQAAERAEAAAESATDSADRAETAAEEADNVLNTIKSFVVPEMFGAYGDGVHDDTVAFQEAVNSGKPVCIPQNKCYRITDTIDFEVANADDARLIFSFGHNNDVRNSQFKMDFADNTKPVFNVLSDGFMFYNLCINAVNNGNKDLTLFQLRRRLVTPPVDPAYYPVDVDVTIEQCSIFNADLAFSFTGRGLNVLYNNIITCNRVAVIAWPGDTGDSGGMWHNDATGMRAIRFESNRFHSIGGSIGAGANTMYAITISSGNAYGFRFVNNLFDRGDIQFLYCEEETDNWLISGNTFSGMRGGDGFIWINNTMNRVTFADNVLTLPQAAANYSLVYWIRVAGYMLNCNISGNTVERIDNGNAIIIQAFGEDPATAIDGCVISNNVISSVMGNSTRRGMIGIPNHSTVNQTAITGNVIKEVQGSNLNYGIVRCSGTATMNGVTICGNSPNIPDYTTDYLLNGVTANKCKFDFAIGAETTATGTTSGYIA